MSRIVHYLFLNNNLSKGDELVDSSLFLTKASNLAEDLNENVEDEVDDHLDPISTVVLPTRISKKVKLDRVPVRRSERLKKARRSK